MPDISGQLIKDSYSYILQVDTSTGYVYRVNGNVPVNPIFSSGLTVFSAFTFVDGNQQNGYVLTSDGNGNSRWASVSGTSVSSVTASTGLSGNSTTGAITLINTAPDKTVVITGGTNIQVISDYPNFGINFTGQTSSAFTGGTVSGATNFTNGLTANTISATTYENIPIPTLQQVTDQPSGNTTTNELISLDGDYRGKLTSTEVIIENGSTDDITSLSTNQIIRLVNIGSVATTQALNFSTINTNGVVTIPNATGTIPLSVNNYFADTGGTITIPLDYLPLSGGTVTGDTIFEYGLTANTLTITGLTSSTDSNVVTIDDSGVLHTYPLSGLTGTDGSNTRRFMWDGTGDTVSSAGTFVNGGSDNLNFTDAYLHFSYDYDFYGNPVSTWFDIAQSWTSTYGGDKIILQLTKVGDNSIIGQYFGVSYITPTGNDVVVKLFGPIVATNYTLQVGELYSFSWVLNGADGSGNVYSVSATSGLSGNSITGNITLVNTAPDQTVVITGGTNIEITGTYPDFGINFTGQTSSAFTGGTVSGATNFTNGLTANTISATTYYNVNAVTGGTYSSGTITLSGTGNFQSTITGFPNSFPYLPLSGGTVTGGTIFQSGVTANTISQTQYIDFTTGTTNPSSVAGRVFFDTTQKALSYFDISNNQVPIVMGQQLYTRVWNASGVQIDKGKVIAITGTSNNLPSAILAVNQHGITSARPIGLAAENIPNGSEGLVLNNGILSGITLNTFANGATLYLSDTTPGGYVDSTALLSFTARTNEIGYVLQTGSSIGKIYVNINNEDSNLSLTDIERNILEGNVISSGAYEFTGLTRVSNTLFSVAPLRGWIVKNTYAYATLPDVTNVKYIGTTGTTTPYINTADATYVLVTSASTLLLQSDFPTAKQRRQNIYLGRIVHPNRSTIQNVNNTTDFDVSPMAAIRDLWTPIKLINQGVVPSYYSAGTLNIQTSAGVLWGNGIGWYTDQENPDSVSISGTSPTTFQYRTSTGQTGGDTLVLDCTHYDVNGVITTIPGNSGSQLIRATNQRVYLFTSGLIRIQYGQDWYESLTEAVAAIQSETFTEYPLIRDNAILIGIISVTRGTTNLASDTQAHFTYVSKFGEQFGGTGGLSTTTLQQAYNNTTNPEILTNSAEGALTIQNGTGNADNVTNLLEGKNSGTTTTSFIRADGLISGSSVSAPTISGTTYYGINAATGGTYSNGVITLAGSGTLSTITGLGGSGGGGQVYFLNLSNTQTPYKEFSPVATTAAQQTTGTSISSGVTSTLASFLSPVGYPSVNLLPAGMWSFYLHTYKTNVGDSFTAYAQVYKRTSGGTETLLFSTDSATVDGVSPTPRMALSDVYYSGTSLDLTDRILVVIKGTNGGTSTSTLTLVTEGSLYYSYATTTFGGGTSNYTTGGTYNNSTGILTFTRTDGNSYTAGTFTYLTGVTSDIQTQLNGKVGTTGNETISGQKTFTSGLTANTVFAGSGSISSSAVMESSSTTKGFLPPRMTEAQRLAISSPATALIVYQTDGDEGLYINKSFGWVQII